MDTLKLTERFETFSPLDLHFAALMTELSGGNAAVQLASALVSRCREDGNVCIDLAAFAEMEIPAGGPALLCPPLKNWLKQLHGSPVVGRPGEYKPLILVGSRLYLFRYWSYENRVAVHLRESATWLNPEYDGTLLRAGLDRLFPLEGAKEARGPDRRRIAAVLSMLKRFVVISGGPGTGKTTTIARILALLLEQSAGQSRGIVPRIGLCAPTGKAAARLQEAINAAKERIDSPDFVKEAIPSRASTVHRLLKSFSGERSDSGAFDLAPGSSLESGPDFSLESSVGTLPFDILVVDEASMVDLSLFSRLLQALSPQARLVLLGDKDQLASVEAGSVLADICGPGGRGYSPELSGKILALTGECPSMALGKELADFAGDSAGTSPMRDNVVELHRSYRFGEDSGIGEVSRMINLGNAAKALNQMKSGAFGDIAWHRLPAPERLMDMLRDRILRGYSPCFASTVPAEVLERLNRFRILCALREGPYGARAINALIERILSEAGMIRKDEAFYRGRQILITRNDYDLKLFNGDAGIILPDPETGMLRAFFQDPAGGIRKFPPLRLPEHETVYATTVHKSQGSEFAEIVFILPDRVSPVLTRELLYTALTRARTHAEIWGREDIFRIGVDRRIERISGLREALWGI